MSGNQLPASSSVVSTPLSVQIPALNLKHSIQKHVQYNGIIRGILAKLEAEIPELQDLKLSTELTKLVCNTVESIVEKGNPFGIDKEALVVEILTKEFNLTEDEQNQIKQQIGFLFDNKQIKRVKNWPSLFRSGGKFLATKIL